MFSASGQRCNKEQSPVRLLPSDQQATTSPPCPSWTPPGAALLALGQAGRGDQWHFLLGEQMVQRMGAGVTWQGTGKEWDGACVGRWSRKAEGEGDAWGHLWAPYPCHLPVLKRENSGARSNPKMNPLCSAGSISPFIKSWMLLKYSCVIKKRKCKYFISFGLGD